MSGVYIFYRSAETLSKPYCHLQAERGIASPGLGELRALSLLTVASFIDESSAFDMLGSKLVNIFKVKQHWQTLALSMTIVGQSRLKAFIPKMIVKR